MKTTISVLKARFIRLYHSRWFNKYTVSLLVFALWMCFFDKHNLITQWQLRSTVNRLHAEMEDYKVRLDNASRERKSLETDQERFAREKYFMHRPDEEVFVMEQ